VQQLQQGGPVTFRSALVPPYARKTVTLEDALPLASFEADFHRRDVVSTKGVAQ